MSKTALILVDLQNDFMPGGALAVTDGDATVDHANSILSRYDIVVATQDWHPADHGSFADRHDGRSPGDVIDLDGIDQVLWPVHCVQGTPGASFHSSLEIGQVDHVVRKGANPRVDSYSGFHDNGNRGDTGLAELLRARGVDAVHVLGLATDYCVRFTALDAVAEGFSTTLLLAGCRGVELEPGDVDRAVEEMRVAGVRIDRSHG